MAETYGILDMRELPPARAAVFACGLRADARIIGRIGGHAPPGDTLLLAAICDRLTTLVWQNTKDGVKGRNRPQQLLPKLLGTDQPEQQVEAFDDPADFWRARNRILGG